MARARSRATMLAMDTGSAVGGARDGDGAAAPRTLVRSPELAELRAFCAAVDLASIGRAARLLQVSQPALSKRLRALEAVAGTRLLERSTRGVRPTASGLRLYGAARRLLTDAEAVEELMGGFAPASAPVRLAASPTLAECWLPDVLVALEAAHERHLSVEVVAANSATVRRMVCDGVADLGLAALDPDGSADGLAETVVCEDELVVAVPPGHPWAAAAEIDPHELAITPIVRRDPGAASRRVVDAALAAADVTPAPPLAELGSTAAARAAALAEGVPVLLSTSALGPDERELVGRRVAGLRFRRRFALLHPGCLDDAAPPVRALARALLERAADASRSHEPVAV